MCRFLFPSVLFFVFTSFGRTQTDINIQVSSDFTWKTESATINGGFIIDGASNLWMLNSYNDALWMNASTGNWAIGGIYDLPGIQDIWHPVYNDSVLLRKEFVVPVADSYTGVINAQVDNWYNIYFNGTFLGHGSYEPTLPGNYSISTSLDGCVGNVIALEARDYGGYWGVKLDVNITAHNVLNTPVALNETAVKCDEFQANWDVVSTADSYLLDVSTDSNFLTFYSVYQDYDVGNNLNFVLNSLPPDIYYYRLRAKRINASGTKISCYSNTILVELDSVDYQLYGMDTICAGDEIFIYASSDSGSTFQWYGPSGVSSLDSSIQIFNAQGSNSGYYHVIISTPNCGDFGDSLALVVLDQSDWIITTNNEYCSLGDSSLFLLDTLHTSATGGSWIGPGIINSQLGIFNPSLAGPGQHEVWYIVNGHCPDTLKASVTVNNGNPFMGLVIPNVITPNGDNLNDVFIPQLTGEENINLFIYDRWGVLMFQEPHLSNGWEGRNNNIPVSEGTYYWILTSNDNCNMNQLVTKAGFVQVFRP